MVQLSHPHMTTGKTIVLTIWTFVSKVMSLLFKRKPVNGVPQKHTKVNSLVNDTLKKALNRAPLTQGKLNSQVNETLKKLLKRDRKSVV